MAVESKPLFHPEVIRQQVRAFNLPETVADWQPKLQHWAGLIASGRADDFNLRRSEMRRAGVRVDEHPDRIRNLGGQPVDLEGAEQADDSAGEPLHRLRDAVQLGDPSLGVLVQAPVDLLEQPLVDQAAEVGTRHSQSVELARTRLVVPDVLVDVCPDCGHMISIAPEALPQLREAGCWK